jgi:hypothetical protein
MVRDGVHDTLYIYIYIYRYVNPLIKAHCTLLKANKDTASILCYVYIHM